MPDELSAINAILDEVANDRTVPRNVRTAVLSAKADLANEKLDMELRISSAIAVLDEVANDINLPPYSRTQVWNIVSRLETLLASTKKA
jgi:hypothetical protein